MWFKFPVKFKINGRRAEWDNIEEGEKCVYCMILMHPSEEREKYARLPTSRGWRCPQCNWYHPDDNNVDEKMINDFYWKKHLQEE